MKAVLIAGVPGTGKSTLIRALMKEDEYVLREPIKMLKMHTGKNYGYDIIGDYSDPNEVFPGGDRLSMAVSVQFKEWVIGSKPEKLLIEGDRLVGNSTIEFLLKEGYRVELIVISADQTEVKRRFVQRGSEQGEQFLKAKQTKVDNLSGRLDLQMEDALHFYKNNNWLDQDLILKKIRESLE